MCSPGEHIPLIRPTLTPICMGAMPTKQAWRNQSGKLRNGLTQSLQG